MKPGKLFISVVALWIVLLLSACGGAQGLGSQPVNDQPAAKAKAVEVAFTGVIEAMSGNVWTVEGQTTSVASSVVHDGPFQVGDTIRVEGRVGPDGIVQATNVEDPALADQPPMPALTATQVPVTSETQAPVSIAPTAPVATTAPDVIFIPTATTNGSYNSSGDDHGSSNSNESDDDD